MTEPSAKPHHSWFRFRLRTLLIAVTVLCIWLGFETTQAVKQRRAVELVKKISGEVVYDHQRTATGNTNPLAEPWAPRWLRELVGEDYFVTVSEVHIPANRYSNGQPPWPVTSMSDEDLECLGRLAWLKELSLSGVPITDDGLRRLKGLTNLESFYLGSSQITDVSIDTIRGFTRLKKLGLGWKRWPLAATVTRVTDQGMARLTNLKSLQRLLLDGTCITDAGLKHVAMFSDLQVLFLQDTAVTDEGVAELNGLKQLSGIVLTNPKITDRSLKMMALHPNLEFLSLDGTSVTDEGLSHLRSLTKLEYLGLSGTQVTGEGLAELTTIERLWVDHTRVSDEALRHIGQMSKLQLFSLEGTAVTDLGLDHLQGLTRLISIDLNDTEVTDLALVRLGTIPMTRLSLEGTQVTEPAVEKFRKAMKIEVHTDAKPDPSRGL